MVIKRTTENTCPKTGTGEGGTVESVIAVKIALLSRKRAGKVDDHEERLRWTLAVCSEVMGRKGNCRTDAASVSSEKGWLEDEKHCDKKWLVRSLRQNIPGLLLNGRWRLSDVDSLRGDMNAVKWLLGFAPCFLAAHILICTALGRCAIWE